MSKNKRRKIKKTFKKTILGLTIGTSLISLIPNIEYRISLYNAKSNSYIEKTIDGDKSKEEKVASIFSYAIDNNSNIPDEDKSKIKEVFIENVINKFGSYFTDETIYNMYAVASTEKIVEMFKFNKEHSWWDGHYNSYINTFSLYDSVSEIDDETLTHEQLHAILKSGLFSNGFVTGIGLWKGIGADEGATTLICDGSSYYNQQKDINRLGSIIGYDILMKCYLNSDLDSLKKELCHYLKKEEVNTFFRNLDLNVLSMYLDDFYYKNSIKYDEEKLQNNIKNRNIENENILKRLFEKKYGYSVNESDLGKLIFYDSNIEDKNSIDENSDYAKYNLFWDIYPTKNDNIIIRFDVHNGGSLEEPFIVWSNDYTFNREELESTKIDELINKTTKDDNILFKGIVLQKSYK